MPPQDNFSRNYPNPDHQARSDLPKDRTPPIPPEQVNEPPGLGALLHDYRAMSSSQNFRGSEDDRRRDQLMNRDVPPHAAGFGNIPDFRGDAVGDRNENIAPRDIREREMARPFDERDRNMHGHFDNRERDFRGPPDHLSRGAYDDSSYTMRGPYDNRAPDTPYDNSLHDVRGPYDNRVPRRPYDNSPHDMQGRYDNRDPDRPSQDMLGPYDNREPGMSRPRGPMMERDSRGFRGSDFPPRGFPDPGNRDYLDREYSDPSRGMPPFREHGVSGFPPRDMRGPMGPIGEPESLMDLDYNDQYARGGGPPPFSRGPAPPPMEDDRYDRPPQFQQDEFATNTFRSGPPMPPPRGPPVPDRGFESGPPYQERW